VKTKQVPLMRQSLWYIRNVLTKLASPNRAGGNRLIFIEGIRASGSLGQHHTLQIVLDTDNPWWIGETDRLLSSLLFMSKS